MKTQIFTLVLLGSLTVSLFSSAQQEAKTLINDETTINTEGLGFFVAPTYGLTEMDGSMSSLLHLRAGVNIKDQFSFGPAFNLSLNEINPQSETVPNVYMDYWSVGGFAEYTLMSKKMVHLTFPLFIGYGEVEMDNEAGGAGLGEASFFQVEPTALLEVNLHKYVRLNLGVGYRWINEMNYRNMNQSDLSGITGYIGLKFGLFR